MQFMFTLKIFLKKLKLVNYLIYFLNWIFMIYEFMRLVIFFDLPMTTKKKSVFTVDLENI